MGEHRQKNIDRWVERSMIDQSNPDQSDGISGNLEVIRSIALLPF